MPDTLDIVEKQCLVNYPNDANGFTWHALVLLRPTATPRVWAASSPDFSVEIINLREHRIGGLGLWL
jgi:hypothetical protein